MRPYNRGHTGVANSIGAVLMDSSGPAWLLHEDCSEDNYSGTTGLFISAAKGESK